MPSPIRKAIKRILPAPRPHWVGNGFNVYPVFASLAFTEALSPWLMFDYAAPRSFRPTNKRLGVGQHPHRGFETVTIAFQGGVEHQDSVGNNDVIGPGDVQWMTAGRGIIHEEYHSTSFAKNGGTFEMCQLWVNLPAKDKMHAPRYQPILDKQIPVVPLSAPRLARRVTRMEPRRASSPARLATRAARPQPLRQSSSLTSRCQTRISRSSSTCQRATRPSCLFARWFGRRRWRKQWQDGREGGGRADGRATRRRRDGA